MGHITEINEGEVIDLNLPILNSRNAKVVIEEADCDAQMNFDDVEIFDEVDNDVDDSTVMPSDQTSCKIEEISQKEDEIEQKIYAHTIGDHFVRFFYSLLQNPTPEAQQKLILLFLETSTFVFQKHIVVGVVNILQKLKFLTPINNCVLEATQFSASPTPNRVQTTPRSFYEFTYDIRYCNNLIFQYLEGVEVEVGGVAHIKNIFRDAFNGLTESMQHISWKQIFLLVPLSLNERTYVIQKMEFQVV